MRPSLRTLSYAVPRQLRRKTRTPSSRAGEEFRAKKNVEGLREASVQLADEVLVVAAVTEENAVSRVRHWPMLCTDVPEPVSTCGTWARCIRTVASRNAVWAER